MSFGDFVIGAESPTGEDNRAGSGALSKYQFMPATAAALARRTSWGAGLTPDTVKAAVQGDPTGGRAKELYGLYEGDSRAALNRVGLPVDQTSILALHRFGQSGGTSLLQAPANMPVTQWVNSVNWGPGVAADAVIRQNRLDRYNTVGDLRSGFLGAKGQPQSIGDVTAAGGLALPAAQPFAPEAASPRANPALANALLADLFTIPQPRRRPRRG